MGVFFNILVSYFLSKSRCDAHNKKSQEKWEAMRKKTKIKLTISEPRVECTYVPNSSNNNLTPTFERDLLADLSEAIKQKKSTKFLHNNIFGKLVREGDYSNALCHYIIFEIYNVCWADENKLNEFHRGKNAFLPEWRKPNKVSLDGGYFLECVNALKIDTKDKFKEFFMNVDINEPVELPFSKKELCDVFMKGWDAFVKERKEFKRNNPKLVKDGEF